MQVKREKQDLKVTRKKTKKEGRGTRKDVVKRTKIKPFAHPKDIILLGAKRGWGEKDPHLIGVNLKDRLVGWHCAPPLFCS